jgi:sorbitol-specific phosphotransferase system component IIC
MLAVAKAIVVLVALFFLLLGVLAFVKPARIHGFLLGFAGNALKHYTELLVRLLVGTSLLLVARESAYTGVLSGFGWLLIITTAVMALIPWRVHHRFTQSAVPKALRFLPLMGLASLAIGAFLLWAMVAGAG